MTNGFSVESGTRILLLKEAVSPESSGKFALVWVRMIACAIQEPTSIHCEVERAKIVWK